VLYRKGLWWWLRVVGRFPEERRLQLRSEVEEELSRPRRGKEISGKRPICARPLW